MAFFIDKNDRAFKIQYGIIKYKELLTVEYKSKFWEEMIDRKLIIKIMNITGSGIQFLFISK